MKTFWLFIGFLLHIIFLIGCSQSPVTVIGDPFPEVIEENGKIYIVDITGQRWDVTHAKEKYGFEPSKFQFGLGITGVPAINNPIMIDPEDEDYPNDNDDFLILGSVLNGQTKAYPLSRMSQNEVANDIMIGYPDIHVAFAF